MKYSKLKPARLFLLMIIGGTFGVTIQGLVPFHSIVIFGLFLLLLQGTRRGFLWAVIAGLLYETVSPFPPFVFLISLFITLGACSLILTKYVSHRTFFGALLVGAIGATLYEIFVFLFSRFGILIADDWTPIFDRQYVEFILLRTLSGALALGLLTLFAKQISPGVRGVMITHPR